MPADPVRRIFDITVRQDGEFFRIYVTGEGFLYHMVRNIAGALLDAGTGKKRRAIWPASWKPGTGSYSA